MQLFVLLIPTARRALIIKKATVRWFDDAAADFREVLRLDAQNAEAHSALGYVLACQGRRSEAEATVTPALLYAGVNYMPLHTAACLYSELSIYY